MNTFIEQWLLCFNFSFWYDILTWTIPVWWGSNHFCLHHLIGKFRFFLFVEFLFQNLMSLHHFASLINCLIWTLTLASCQNRLLNLHLWSISDCFPVHWMLFFAKSVWTRTLFSLQFHHFLPIKLILHWGTILLTNNIEILWLMRFQQLIGLSLWTYFVFYMHRL